MLPMRHHDDLGKSRGNSLSPDMSHFTQSQPTGDSLLAWLDLIFPSRLIMIWENGELGKCKLGLSFPMFGFQSRLSGIMNIQCQHHDTHTHIDTIEVLFCRIRVEMERKSGGLGPAHPLRHQQQESPWLPPSQPHICLRGADLRGEENT